MDGAAVSTFAQRPVFAAQGFRGKIMVSACRVLSLTVAMVSLLSVLTGSAAAATMGMIDDFQDGTVAGWRGASPANVANAGPGGAGDNALRVTATGDRAVIVNTEQWMGNYTAAGITQLSLDVRNESTFALALRIGFAQGGVGPNGIGDTYVSATAVSVPNDGQWHQIALSLAPEDFVPHLANTNPTPDAAAALAAVGHLRILHNPIPNFQGANVLATFYFDNIQAVPEPAAWALAAGGLGLLGIRRRRARA
jgi:hypothetical protein